MDRRGVVEDLKECVQLAVRNREIRSMGEASKQRMVGNDYLFPGSRAVKMLAPPMAIAVPVLRAKPPMAMKPKGQEQEQEQEREQAGSLDGEGAAVTGEGEAGIGQERESTDVLERDAIPRVVEVKLDEMVTVRPGEESKLNAKNIPSGANMYHDRMWILELLADAPQVQQRRRPAEREMRTYSGRRRNARPCSVGTRLGATAREHGSSRLSPLHNADTNADASAAEYDSLSDMTSNNSLDAHAANAYRDACRLYGSVHTSFVPIAVGTPRSPKTMSPKWRAYLGLPTIPVMSYTSTNAGHESESTRSRDSKDSGNTTIVDDFDVDRYKAASVSTPPSAARARSATKASYGSNLIESIRTHGTPPARNRLTPTRPQSARRSRTCPHNGRNITHPQSSISHTPGSVGDSAPKGHAVQAQAGFQDKAGENRRSRSAQKHARSPETHCNPNTEFVSLSSLASSRAHVSQAQAKSERKSDDLDDYDIYDDYDVYDVAALALDEDEGAFDNCTEEYLRGTGQHDNDSDGVRYAGNHAGTHAGTHDEGKGPAEDVNGKEEKIQPSVNEDDVVLYDDAYDDTAYCDGDDLVDRNRFSQESEGLTDKELSLDSSNETKIAKIGKAVAQKRGGRVKTNGRGVLDVLDIDGPCASNMQSGHVRCDKDSLSDIVKEERADLLADVPAYSLTLGSSIKQRPKSRHLRCSRKAKSSPRTFDALYKYTSRLKIANGEPTIALRKSRDVHKFVDIVTNGATHDPPSHTGSTVSKGVVSRPSSSARGADRVRGLGMNGMTGCSKSPVRRRVRLKHDCDAFSSDAFIM